MLDNLLSIVTFLPLVSAIVLAVFLRGDDAAAQLGAKRVALYARWAPFSSRSRSGGVRPERIPAFSWWRRPSGSSG